MNMTLKYLAGMLAITFLLATGIAGAQQTQQGDLQPQGDRQRTDSQRQSAATTGGTASGRLPAGFALKENARTAAVEEAIRNVLRTATGAAMAGDINKLVEQLSHPDRERLQAQAATDFNPLRQSVGVLTNAFQEAYGMAANLTEQDLSALNMTITVGEIANPAAVTNWPLDPLAGMTDVAITEESAVSRGPLRTAWRGAARTATGVVNRDYMAEGRDVAVVVLPPAGGIPQLTISMTHEAIDFWKIDIPDNMDLATLQRNLSDQISKFTSETRTWPPDQNETERLLARRVLIALYDVEVSNAQDAATSGAGTNQ